MVSDLQSAPIRAIGGRLKIRGHPAPPLGEFADRAGWPATEGADLRREFPSEGLRLRLALWGQNSPPGGGSPIRGPASPTPPSASAADGNENWGRGLGETRPPCPLPPFPVLVRCSSAFPSMSCLEIRVPRPEFLNPAPPASRPFASIGALSSLRSFYTAERSPLRRFPPVPAHLCPQHQPFPRLENRGRPVGPGSPSAPGADWSGNWGKGTRGDLLPELFSPVSRRFSQLIGVSADELLRNSGPATRISRTRPPRPEPIRSDRGSFEPPIVAKGGGESPPPVSPVWRPSSWAASALPPIWKLGEANYARFPIGPRGRLERELGEGNSGSLAPLAPSPRSPSPVVAHRRFCR